MGGSGVAEGKVARVIVCAWGGLNLDGRGIKCEIKCGTKSKGKGPNASGALLRVRRMGRGSFCWREA